MKQNRNIVRLNESQLKKLIAESVKRVLSEKKLENSFKSKEDMTRYRDMYSPYSDTHIIDTDGEYYDSETDGGGKWGSGPYMNYVSHDFADGYDYCGDDDYNEYASDYNDRLYKRLATKGGQMSYDWDEQQRKNERDLDYSKLDAEFGRKYRDLDKYYSPKEMEYADRDKHLWVHDGTSTPFFSADDNYEKGRAEKEIKKDELDNWRRLNYKYRHFNESRLHKIVSESIDRILKNK